MALDLRFDVRTIWNPAQLQAEQRRNKRRALFRMAAFVRTRQRSLIKTRKSRKPAPRGSPPISHTSRKPNMRSIRFAVDVAADDAVIGPIVFTGRHTGKPAPETLEHGGATDQTLDDGQRRRIRVAAHPSARPALEMEISKFPDLLAG